MSDQVDMTPRPISEVCFDCESARKCWSKELHEAGYNGCVATIDSVNDLLYNTDSTVIGTGWVSNSYPDGYNPSSHTNDIPVVRSVTRCNFVKSRSGKSHPKFMNSLPKRRDICIKCSEPIYEGYKFCPECGNKL